MKINKLTFLLLTLLLTGCSFNPSSSNDSNNKGNENSQNPSNDNGSSNNGNNNDNNTGDNGGSTNEDGNTDTPIDGSPTTKPIIQDTPILHCWNWSMNNINANLQNIKDAGFKAIQISPMQTQKDYYGANGGDTVSYGWWKLYQPISFSIATKDHAIGVKSELTAMCQKAGQLGIDVVVDVVFNHMANINENTLESDGTPKVNSQVANYESYIYEHRNDSNNPTFHHNKNATGSGAETQYYPYGGLPDLNTSNEKVQERALDYLKECIDCGVDGFRFDAAKHIETPDDPQYPSDFWTNTLGEAKKYYKNKYNKDLFAYGEILGNPLGRSNSVYTKMMSITDSAQSSDVLNAIKKKDLSKIKETYNSKVPANKLVIWGESHDTFANNDGESKTVSQEDIDKAYAIQTSRKDVSSLYLARPNNINSDRMGAVGSTSYKGGVVKAINNFHTYFADESEKVITENNCFINVRGKNGATIVNINNSSINVKVTTTGLENGTYVDLISNKKFTVSNNEVTVSFTNGVCVLVNESMASDINNQQGSEEPSGTTTYILTNTKGWDVFNDNAKVYAYVTGGTYSSGEWIICTKVSSTSISFTCDSSATTCKIVRFTPSMSSPGWNQQIWNQTSDIPLGENTAINYSIGN